jgi:O-antigen ligase
MPGSFYNKSRNTILLLLLMAMLSSVFISRAALSVSMGLFVITAFLHNNIKKQLTVYLSSPLLWGMSLLFLLPLISGLWSTDKKVWMELVRIKLPLLFLPLAFAGPFAFSRQQWKRLAVFFIAIITTGTVWSMIQYAADMTDIQAAYLKAKTIPTPLHNDHVRFSWLVSTAILLAAWLCRREWMQYKKWSLVWSIVAVWLIVFLHILAARTGLLCLYAMLLVTSVWWLIKKVNRRSASWKYGIAGLLIIILLPVLAWYTLPTFQNRVKYFRYDFSYAGKVQYLPGGNDAMRVISLKTGWQVMNNHAATGVGYGDVLQEVNALYEKNYPQMTAADKLLYPSSEWLVYGAACGWGGLLLFSCCMVIPFLIQVKNKGLWYLLNLSTAISFLFDIGLDVQYGVFVYAFIILWWWKWNTDGTEALK